MKETQQSVSEWALETFGCRGVQYRALLVLEEALELCMACDVTPASRDHWIKEVVAKVDAQRFEKFDGNAGLSCAQEETADVLSTLYALASTLDFDAHETLDRKMAFNRSRPQSYYDRKTREKGL